MKKYSCPSRLPGFTLLEMIISITIGLLVIGFVYKILLDLEKSWGTYQHKQNEITSLLLLKQTLDNDIDKSVYIQSYNQNFIHLITENDSVVYQINHLIIRSFHGQCDTFPVTVNNVMVTFVKSLENSYIIRKIKFDILSPISIKEINFEKNYTSGELIHFIAMQDSVYEH